MSWQGSGGSKQASGELVWDGTDNIMCATTRHGFMNFPCTVCVRYRFGDLVAMVADHYKTQPGAGPYNFQPVYYW